MSVYSGGQTGTPSNLPTYGFYQPWHRWQDWVNLILGIWLVISPWAMNTAMGATGADWNLWIIGIVVVMMSLLSLATPTAAWPEWVSMIAGIWLFISPWAIHTFNSSVQWNDWIAGIVLFILSLWTASQVSGAAAPKT